MYKYFFKRFFDFWVALFLPQLGEVPGGLALIGSIVVLVTAAAYSLTGDKQSA